MKTSCLYALVSLSAIAVGCGFTKDFGEVETESGTGPERGTDGGTLGDEDNGSGNATDDFPPPLPSDSVDILFVIDNSGGMGRAQASLAATIDSMTTPLMNAGVSFRLAVTTTDSGNPWCNGTTPERGAFVMSSCRSRLPSFVFEGTTMVDASQEACLDVCGEEQILLTPTATEDDPTLTTRPWIEWEAVGAHNLGGVPLASVAQCALPMGVNGCGYEQPLKSMRWALTFAQEGDTAQAGFLRSDANLLIVIVTDEVDCSYNQESIFLPNGERTFWSLPDEATPTSAVCWNAGVTCSESGCESSDLAPDGSQALNDAEASLQPVSGFVDELKALQLAKSQGRVRVMALLGREQDGSFTYGAGTDVDYSNDYGTGPGCEGSSTIALPPVRLRETVNALNEAPDQGIYSICADNYAEPLAAMAAQVISWSQ